MTFLKNPTLQVNTYTSSSKYTFVINEHHLENKTTPYLFIIIFIYDSSIALNPIKWILALYN